LPKSIVMPMLSKLFGVLSCSRSLAPAQSGFAVRRTPGTGFVVTSPREDTMFTSRPATGIFIPAWAL
jgi:hypothetical protein